jgi:hypothetical protein
MTQPLFKLQSLKPYPKKKSFVEQDMYELG